VPGLIPKYQDVNQPCTLYIQPIPVVYRWKGPTSLVQINQVFGLSGQI